MKSYALINLRTLNIYQFDHRDEMLTARQDLADRDTETIILKWHTQADTYLQPEVCE